MSLGHGSGRAGDGAPPTNKGMIVAAGVLLAIPLVALLWVSSYAKETPRLFGFPFFFWYQLLWVFICAALTYTAYRLVLAARGQGTRDAHPDAAQAKHDSHPVDGEGA
jgi:Na+/proline symporter